MRTDQPSGSFARVIRADTKKAGLLFAGTESSMYVSFDDGDNWQSLMLNLPNTSYRDMVIKDNDLVVGTYGRGIWILDDISPLRQITPAIASEPAHLFKPGDAIRVRRNVNGDTPFPPEVPHALNPAARRDHLLLSRAKPSGDITLDVLDAAGNVVRHIRARRFRRSAKRRRPFPNFWLEEAEADADGDRHEPDQLGTSGTTIRRRSRTATRSTPIPARRRRRPKVRSRSPGTYTLKLTVDGRSYSQTVMVTQDPRSPATVAAIRAQHVLQMRITEGLRASYAAREMAAALRTAVRGAVPAAAQGIADAAARATALTAQLDTVVGLDGGGRGGFGGRPPAPSFRSINGALVTQMNAQDLGDMAPTPAALAAFAATCKELQTALATWDRLRGTEFTAFNGTLTAAGRPPISVTFQTVQSPKC